MDCKFAIVPVESLQEVDFRATAERGPDTCRKSLDGTLAVVSWHGERPDGIEGDEYMLDALRMVLAGSEWTQPNTDEVGAPVVLPQIEE